MSATNRLSDNDDQGDIQEFRHGYGLQYWTDGAHYEGEWYFNKAEGQGTFWHAEGDGDIQKSVAVLAHQF